MGNQKIYESEFERGGKYIYTRFSTKSRLCSRININSDMEDLLQKAMNQNFVPVVDDQKKFIGIVTRKSIMEYCYEKLKNLPEDY